MTTPTTELLTDDELDALDTFVLAHMAPRGKDSVRAYARAIERALLARLGEQQPVWWMVVDPSKPTKQQSIWARPPSDDDIRSYEMQYGLPPQSLVVVPLYAAPIPSPAPVDDLATLVARLVRALRKAAPGDELCDKAMDYLKRNDLAPSPFRTTHPSPAPVGAQEREALRELLSTDVARDVLLRLHDGLGTDTDDGRAWLRAKALAARSAAQGAVQVPADLPQRTFAALQAMTEGILTRGDAQYMRRRLEECVAIMAEHGWQTPTPWPDLLPIKAEFAAPAHAGERSDGRGA